MKILLWMPVDYQYKIVTGCCWLAITSRSPCYMPTVDAIREPALSNGTNDTAHQI